MVASRVQSPVAHASRVSLVYKQLARYIMMNGLKPGDLLPTQPELRRLFRVSNDTLAAIMQMLVGQGAVTRQQGVGTILVNMESLMQCGWVVGVATMTAPSIGQNSFFALLSHQILGRLFAIGCRSSTYFRCAKPHWPCHRLSDFAGLGEDVAAGRIDGLLILTSLAAADWKGLLKQDVPAFHVGVWDALPCGVVVDKLAMADHAIRLFSEKGCRHIGVMMDSGDGMPERSVETHLARQGHGVRVEGLSAVIPGVLPVPGIAETMARAMLERPLRGRPDALIFGDDHAAQEVSRILAQSGGYRPRIAVITNRQLPMPFYLPVSRFEVDLGELADRGVRLFHERLMNPKSPERMEYVVPRWMESG
jgi:hypothetical protein